MDISATNKNLRWRHQDGRSDKCPCCTIHVETVEHVILCPEIGRVETFMQSSQALGQWMEEADTDPYLIDCIVDYVQGQGMVTMALASSRTFAGYDRMAKVFRRDGLKRNSSSTATVLCCQWLSDEFGQMVIWTHHMAA